jgi:hypothetical protein
MPNAVSLFAQATERRPEPFRDAWRTGSFVTPPPHTVMEQFDLKKQNIPIYFLQILTK